MKKTLLLMILDGFGYSPKLEGNAIAGAETPCLDRLFSQYPHTLIGASGEDVGLPDGQMGNSEVGHTNIGAGRIVYQELTRITKAAREGTLQENPVLLEAMERCRVQGRALHLAGLLSDGGVHSHNSHLYSLLKMAAGLGLRDVWVHCFLDGRDVAPSSGKEYILQLEEELRRIGTGKIATVMGRYYAMDRDHRWERIQKAYDAIALGEGVQAAGAAQAVEDSYSRGVTDEFVLPAVVAGAAPVREGDSFLFFNFRPDRARELTRAFVDKSFAGFVRKRGYFPVHFVTMTQYDAAMPGVQVAFPPQKLENTLGECLSRQGLRQLRIAETEKYAHVTFFFNGGVETVFPGEDRVLIPSPKVATYDLQPEMSAYEVTEELLRRLKEEKYDVVILNFANCDMVGHTGVYEAAVKAVEAVDACVGRIAGALLEQGGVLLLTADHGNADQMTAGDGTPFTAHTTNPVPLLAAGIPCRLREGGRLADLAPTMLEILGMPKPPQMDGCSLLLPPQ